MNAKKVPVTSLLLAGCLALYTVATAADGGRLAGQARDAALILSEPSDLSPLLELSASRRVVMLGESTHGTAEFYNWRRDISLALIRDHGFDFILVEGDGESWYQTRPYLAGETETGDKKEFIAGIFTRWPSWLWANEETARLIDDLRQHNQKQAPEKRAFIYGMDLYGAPKAMPMLLDKVAPIDRDLRDKLALDYRELMAFGDDLSAYARSTAGNRMTKGPRRALRRIEEWTKREDNADQEIAFRLLHLAHIVNDAERHYRAMATPDKDSWNVRADHFHQVLLRLLEHYGPDSRGIVWAHNTHIGDARATPMATQGQRNIGQMARNHLGNDDVLLVGFTTAMGQAIAAPAWGGAWRAKPIPEPQPGSLEYKLMDYGPEQFLLIFNQIPSLAPFMEVMGHRAVGVVYNPGLEARNYVPTIPARRYNALVFVRQTTPLNLFSF